MNWCKNTDSSKKGIAKLTSIQTPGEAVKAKITQLRYTVCETSP